MDPRLLVIVTCLSLALAVSHATLTSQDYWQSMLPNTPMPRAIRDLLPSGSGPKREPMIIADSRLFSSALPIIYSKNDSSDELVSDTNVAIFFQEKDLHSGTIMNLCFPKPTHAGAPFMPREEAKLIPFSSNNFSHVLQRFSVDPKSKEAQVMKKIIQICENPAMEGEDKVCATSLEFMVDFSTAKLGSNVEALSSDVKKEETKKRPYTIRGDVKKMAGDEAVVCHPLPYVYAVFYCHATEGARTYKVPLVGADGKKISNTVAVCHTNTTNWNPNFMAFRILKVKPGTVPVCHFLPEGHVVWVSKYKTRRE